MKKKKATLLYFFTSIIIIIGIIGYIIFNVSNTNKLYEYSVEYLSCENATVNDIGTSGAYEIKISGYRMMKVNASFTNNSNKNIQISENKFSDENFKTTYDAFQQLGFYSKLFFPNKTENITFLIYVADDLTDEKEILKKLDEHAKMFSVTKV